MTHGSLPPLLSLLLLLLLSPRGGRAQNAACQTCSSWAQSGSQCTECPAGKEPNPDRNGCDVCGSTSYSGDGSECVECPAGSAPVDDGNGGGYRNSCAVCVAPSFANAVTGLCAQCVAGQQRSNMGDGCDDCLSETALSLYYSGNPEQGNQRSKGNLVSPDGTDCVACPAGTQPGGDFDDELLSGSYNYDDPPPTWLSAAASSAKKRPTACVACEAGTMSEWGVECTSCANVGAGVGTVYAPSSDKTMCEACPAGKWSNAGHSCDVCAAGMEVNGGQVSKNEEICTNNEDICIKNEEFCMKNEECCI